MAEIYQPKHLQFWPTQVFTADWRLRWMYTPSQELVEQALMGDMPKGMQPRIPPGFEFYGDGDVQKSGSIRFSHTELFLRLTLLPTEEQLALYKMFYELLWESGKENVEIEIRWSRNLRRTRILRVDGKHDICLSLI